MKLVKSPWKIQSIFVWQIRATVFFSIVTFWMDVTMASITGSSQCDRNSQVLILDVDNCLYNENALCQMTKAGGIECQIVRNTHVFAERYFGMDTVEADELYQKCGSTIEGLRDIYLNMKEEERPFDSVQEMMSEFYEVVYSNIDYSGLIELQCRKNLASTLIDDLTGYSHEQRAVNDFPIDLLSRISKRHPIWLASNSSEKHVNKIIDVLGLRHRVSIEGILTPDCNESKTNLNSKRHCFPTKKLVKAYWGPIREKYMTEKLYLLEDSSFNLNAANLLGIQGFHVTHMEGQSINEGIKSFLVKGITLPNGDGEDYVFSDVKYLKSKNKVDALSINEELWGKLKKELQRETSSCHALRIVDVGAGLLNMFDKIFGENGLETGVVNEIHYLAYESNSKLLAICRNKLREYGFSSKFDDDDVFCGKIKLCDGGSVDVTVTLKSSDFAGETLDSDVHLLIGCCFADLFEPNLLAKSLLSFLGTAGSKGLGQSRTLIYFPITFSGVTSFYPANTHSADVPSDTAAFRAYAKSLERMGHNLDPLRLVDAMKAHGIELVSCARPSNWNISAKLHPYLWKTMLYFFCSSGLPCLHDENIDGIGWVNRALVNKPNIHVTNVDLLFELNRATLVKESDHEADDIFVEEIEFSAPGVVGKKDKSWSSSLLPNQIEVQSICSLISSGTELKVFNGLFDSAALDVNIKGMADADMEYPLSYGYSLVGKVVKCGSSVSDAETLVGKLVFSFSPHASRHVLDRDAVQIVPDGISADDAIFMPSVETALSLVHDANVRLGESVAIYGQGLIGLLVTAILCRSNIAGNHSLGSVTTFDMVPARLACSCLMGATDALLPSQAENAGPYDISIEISGNGRALQSAIDHTISNGRIILGSWYGNKDIKLKLGIDFHRSHKTIITSQVSEISAPLRGLWTKSRRFDLTWELVKVLRPSRLLTKTARLSDAQSTYELLDKGEEIAVAFIYH